MYCNLKLLLRETETERVTHYSTSMHFCQTHKYSFSFQEGPILNYQEGNVCPLFISHLPGGNGRRTGSLRTSSVLFSEPRIKRDVYGLFFCSVQWPALDGGLWLDSFVPNWANSLVTKLGQDPTPFFSLISLWATTVFWLCDFCALLFLMGFKFRANLGQ